MIQINGMAHVNLTVTSFPLPLNSMGNNPSSLHWIPDSE
jgi:hypothetical protein